VLSRENFLTAAECGWFRQRMTGTRRAARLAMLAACIAVAHPGPLLAQDDDDGNFGGRVFEGEPADGQPLEASRTNRASSRLCPPSRCRWMDRWTAA
jgi:hypothetical protein